MRLFSGRKTESQYLSLMNGSAGEVGLAWICRELESACMLFWVEAGVAISQIQSLADLGDIVFRNQLVLLRFYVACGQQRDQQNSVLVALQNSGLVDQIVEIDVEESIELAFKFFIKSVPTLVLLQGNEVLGYADGEQSETALASWVRSF